MFLRLHQALRRALAQHRAELEDIAALARPLMPVRVQPVRIDWLHPHVGPLPVLRRAPAYDSLSSFSRAA
ncbi:hypothetical protein AB0K02_27680 [Streptomyces sp. NPDC049597]|uniref:hypothetical protein n=1 Tax=Streptomyces sp. NPDC049597 TaxID=3155276 RepID=UPI00342BBD7F